MTYQPAANRRVLPLPPIRDALGRTLVAAVASFEAENQPSTPEPLRPSSDEPNQVTLAASAAGADDIAGCVLAVRGEGIEAIGSLGPATVGGCQGGTIGLSAGGSLAFTLDYELLPNYRSRDGAWRVGGVLGRTIVGVALRTTPGA